MASSGTKVSVASSNDRQVPEELKPLHDYYEKWNKEMSGIWSNLVSEKVNDIWGANPNLKISQCIVFGLGSLDLARQEQHPLIGTQFIDHNSAASLLDGGTLNTDVVRQFIVVRMMMDYIKEAAHPIERYFQDPKFTEVDKAYLRYHGFEVLEGKGGMDMVNSTTLMVNLRMDYEEWEHLLKASPPAVYVGPSPQSIIDNKSKDWDFGLLEDYMIHTNTYSFPRSDPREVHEFYLSPHPPPAGAIGLQLDVAAFYQFEVRVDKTVHKDH